MKLGEIARRLECELDGDPSLEITGVAGIEDAQSGELTFFVNRKYRSALDSTRAWAVLVAKDAGPMRIAALRSANPYLDFARAIEIFHPVPRYTAGNPPHRHHCRNGQDRARRSHWAVLLRGRARGNRTQRCDAQFCDDL